MNASEPNSDLTETLKSLKCILCNLMLSIPPILTVSDNEYQCGRCKDIKYANGSWRNSIFERIAGFLNFPCVYPNCGASIPWKDVENHEKTCQFRTITCPIYHESCNQQINISDITQHMVQKHGNHIFFENIVIPVQMFKSDKVIVTSVKHSEKSLNYSVTLQNSNQNSPTITFDKQPVEEFNERKHCFRCMDNRCDLKYHPLSNFNQPTVSTTDKQTSSDDGPQTLEKPIKKNNKNSWYNTPIISTSTTATTLLFSNIFTPRGTNANFSDPCGGSNNPLNSTLKSPTATVNGSGCSVYQLKTTTTATSINNSLNRNWIPAVRLTTSTNINSNSFASNVNSFGTTSTNLISSCSTVPSTTSTNVPSIFQNEAYFDNTNLPIIECTKFNLEHIHKLIGVSSTIMFTITIKTNEEISNESSVPSEDLLVPRCLLNTIDNSDLLRRTLECPICTEYMVSSIFLCERGHHICCNCKILNNCPTCQGVIGEARNFALEDLVEGISISCSSRENGCKFRGNLSAISEHEKKCDYVKN